MSSVLRERHRAWQIDLLIRAAGILMLGAATLAIMTLAKLTGARPSHDATPLELLLAASGFLTASAGMMALTTGRMLFEPVPLPPRWRLHEAAADFVSSEKASSHASGLSFSAQVKWQNPGAQSEDGHALPNKEFMNEAAQSDQTRTDPSTALQTVPRTAATSAWAPVAA